MSYVALYTWKNIKKYSAKRLSHRTQYTFVHYMLNALHFHLSVLVSIELTCVCENFIRRFQKYACWMHKEREMPFGTCNEVILGALYESYSIECAAKMQLFWNSIDFVSERKKKRRNGNRDGGREWKCEILNSLIRDIVYSKQQCSAAEYLYCSAEEKAFPISKRGNQIDVSPNTTHKVCENLYRSERTRQHFRKVDVEKQCT